VNTALAEFELCRKQWNSCKKWPYHGHFCNWCRAGEARGKPKGAISGGFLILGQPPHRLHPFALALVAVILIAEIEYLTFWHKNPTAQAILQMASWKPHSDRHYGIGQASRHNRMVVNAHVIIAKFPCD
jgi:hypothetical protein